MRQIEVRVFEKVQKAVKNGVAAIGTPVHQPMHELPGLSRWQEKLPMTVVMGTFRQPNHAKKEPFTEPLARRSMHGTLRHRSGA